MSYQLRNQEDPNKTLRMSKEAWHSVLDLAEEYGWNPRGTVLPDWWLKSDLSPDGFDPFDPESWDGGYTPNSDRLVLLEDALNLADALEQAFIEYDPELAPSVIHVSLSNPASVVEQVRPSIGAIIAATDFCRLGAFLIERAG